MFTLENYKNSKRRRNRIEQFEENVLKEQQKRETLTLEAIEEAVKAAALEKMSATSLISTTTRLSQNSATPATTTKILSIPQNDHRHHLTTTATSTSRKSMKSINKNLSSSMSCTIIPTSLSLPTTSSSCSSSTSSSLSYSSLPLWSSSSLSLCSSSIIFGKTISRNLWRTTKKLLTLDNTIQQQSTTATTTNTTTLWPHVASINTRQNNCGTPVNGNGDNDVFCFGAADDDHDRRCHSLRRPNHRRHFLLTLMLLLVVCIVNTSSVKAADSLTGKCHISLFL